MTEPLWTHTNSRIIQVVQRADGFRHLADALHLDCKFRSCSMSAVCPDCVKTRYFIGPNAAFSETQCLCFAYFSFSQTPGRQLQRSRFPFLVSAVKICLLSIHSLPCSQRCPDYRVQQDICTLLCLLDGYSLRLIVTEAPFTRNKDHTDRRH